MLTRIINKAMAIIAKLKTPKLGKKGKYIIELVPNPD